MRIGKKGRMEQTREGGIRIPEESLREQKGGAPGSGVLDRCGHRGK